MILGGGWGETGLRGKVCSRCSQRQRPPLTGAKERPRLYPPAPARPGPGPELYPGLRGRRGSIRPVGTLALGQSLSSSQITSSHSTLPLSQTQIWQGTGFHTSRSWYLRPFCTQVTGGTGARRGDGGCQRRASPSPRGSRHPNPTVPSPSVLEAHLDFPFPAFPFFVLCFSFPKSLNAHLLLIRASDSAEAPGQDSYNSFQFSEFKQSFRPGSLPTVTSAHWR